MMSMPTSSVAHRRSSIRRRSDPAPRPARAASTRRGGPCAETASATRARTRGLDSHSSRCPSPERELERALDLVQLALALGVGLVFARALVARAKRRELGEPVVAEERVELLGQTASVWACAFASARTTRECESSSSASLSTVAHVKLIFSASASDTGTEMCRATRSRTATSADAASCRHFANSHLVAACVSQAPISVGAHQVPMRQLLLTLALARTQHALPPRMGMLNRVLMQAGLPDRSSTLRAASTA